MPPPARRLTARRLPAHSGPPRADDRARRARDVFSNGIHLNVIVAADDLAAESWRNMNAINDVVEAILTTTDRLTVAALAGNAAAGVLMLALATDQIWCRAGAVLNLHYRLTGLHGPGSTPCPAASARNTRPGSPTNACRSARLSIAAGLVDRVIGDGAATHRARVTALAESWPVARTTHRG
jgi:putative two-component system hydrogenase maturation factor HypX/HoxX